MVAITVRDVPEEVRNELAARAARSGQSLQEYVRRILVDNAEAPDLAALIARARHRADASGAHLTRDAIVEAVKADRFPDRWEREDG